MATCCFLKVFDVFASPLSRLAMRGFSFLTCFEDNTPLRTTPPQGYLPYFLEMCEIFCTPPRQGQSALILLAGCLVGGGRVQPLRVLVQVLTKLQVQNMETWGIPGMADVSWRPLGTQNWLMLVAVSEEARC